MFTWLRRLILYRLLGGRIMLVLSAIGIVRQLLGRGRRTTVGPDRGGGASPSNRSPAELDASAPPHHWG
jgi:hypothetical protein